MGRHGQPVRRRGRLRLPGERQGEALVSIYGAVDIIDLEAGEVVTIDTGHVVAYAAGHANSRCDGRVQGRTIQSLKSGEGWVFDFTGPGRVLLQSRNPEAFAHWVAEAAPGERRAKASAASAAAAGGGGLGRLFN